MVEDDKLNKFILYFYLYCVFNQIVINEFVQISYDKIRSGHAKNSTKIIFTLFVFFSCDLGRIDKSTFGETSIIMLIGEQV